MAAKVDITVSPSLTSFLEWQLHFWLTYLTKRKGVAARGMSLL